MWIALWIAEFARIHLRDRARAHAHTHTISRDIYGSMAIIITIIIVLQADADVHKRPTHVFANIERAMETNEQKSNVRR